MDELRTLTGEDIKVSTRGILYLGTFDGDKMDVQIGRQFEDSFRALNAYANIPNPESQLVTGETFDELIKEHTILAKKINTPKWVKMMRETL